MIEEIAEEQESLLERIKSFFLRPSNPKNMRALGILILAVGLIVGGFSIGSTPIFHQTHSIPNPNPDPISPLWYDHLGGIVNGQSSIPGWACNTGQIAQTAGQQNRIALTAPNSSTASFCISQNPMNLGPGTDRVLEIDQQEVCVTCTFSSTFSDIGFGAWFLTTNRTLATGVNGASVFQNNPSVLFMVTMDIGCSNTLCTSGTSFFDVFEKTGTDSQQTIISQHGSGKCGGGDSERFCTSWVCNSCSNGGPIGLQSTVVQLNYTASGSSGSGVGQASSAVSVFIQPGTLETQQLNVQNPGLNPNEQLYYGILSDPCSTVCGGSQWQLGFLTSLDPPTQAVSSYQNSMTIGNYQPSQAPCTTTPQVCQVSNAGIFQPLLDALNIALQIVVIGLIAIVNFFAKEIAPLLAAMFVTLVGVLVTVLNAIGSALGLGQLGTNLQNFFSGVFNWLSNIVNNAFGQILNLVNLISQGLSFIGSIFNSVIWQNLIAGLTLIANGFSTILQGWNYLMSLNGSGILGINYFFLFDWVLGMFELSQKGMEGFQTWLNLNELMFRKLAMIMYFFVKESIQIIVWIKQTVVQWI